MAGRSSSLLFGTLATGTGTKENQINAERAALLQHWRLHPWNWLTGRDTTDRSEEWPEGRPIIWTKDERDEVKGVRPFPASKVYLRELVNLFYDDAHRNIALDKCRQMYVSTIILAVLDWWCRFRPNRSMVVSKITEQQAVKLINDKIRDGVEANLPKWVRAVLPQDDAPAGIIRYPKNTAGGGGSTIEAVAENAAKGAVRGGTISIMMLDEAAFQDETGDIIAAAMPAAVRVWVPSSPYLGTAGGTTFYDLVHPEERDTNGGRARVLPTSHPCPGLEVVEDGEWTVARLDYFADPERDAEWLEKERLRSRDKRAFRREYLRDWSSAAGTPFYPEWSDHGGHETHVRAATGLLKNQPIIRGWDFGQRYPACVWMQYDPTARRVWFLRELMIQYIPGATFRDIVLCLSGQIALDDLSAYARQWVRNVEMASGLEAPWFNGGATPTQYIDWGGHEALQERAEVAEDSEERSSAQILASRGIELETNYGAVRSGHLIMRDLLCLQADGQPGAYFDPACRNLIKGVAGEITYAAPTPANPIQEKIRKDGFYSNLHEAALYPLPSLVPLKGHEAVVSRPALGAKLVSPEEFARQQAESFGWTPPY
jgi:hypothetical protein